MSALYLFYALKLVQIALLDEDVIVTVDPRRGQTQPPSEDELKEKSEKRREAYLDFLSDLDAVSPDVEVTDDATPEGTYYLPAARVCLSYARSPCMFLS